MAVPKEVSRLVADLTDLEFGPFVFVNGTPGGSWEAGVEGERVRVAASFVFRGGRTKRVPGTCTVDGKPHALVGIDDLRAFWDEHEGTAAPPESAVLLEIADPSGRPVPRQVQFAADSLTGRAGGKVEVRIGVSGSHWVVGVDLPGGDGLRMVFSQRRRVWDVDPDRPLQVIVNGEDKSAEAGGDVARAVELLTAGSAPPGAGRPPSASAVGSQPARRDTGVETRRMVVIRE